MRAGRVKAGQTTGTFLCDLLVNDRSYRARWEPLVVQRGPEEPSRSAVGRVIADYLIDEGERPDQRDLHRRMKDRVGRALSGRPISAETLRWFVDAFRMSDAHAAQLWSLNGMASAPPAHLGTWVPHPIPAPSNRDWQTLSIHELHTIGANGLPVSHRTMQVIRALVERPSSYLYRFDTNTAGVEVVRGGTAGPITCLGDGLYGVSIVPTNAVPMGQTASLEYLTVFDYSAAPPAQFRRGVTRRVENLEMRIQFHPHRLPAVLTWATWSSLDGPAVESEVVDLDGEHSAHRYLATIEQTIVGYTWEWPSCDTHG